MEVNIEESGVLKIATQIMDDAKSLYAEVNKLNATIDTINTAWNGNDALKYVNVMREKYIVGLQELKKIIEDYSLYLKNIPEAYSCLDESFKGKKIDV